MTSFVAADEDLVFLEEKYRAIEALRRARTLSGASADDAALGALAARWPGALRELDDLSDEAIATRLDELARARRGETAPLPWMSAQAAFHVAARGALACKRWLEGRKVVDDALRDAFGRALADGSLPREAQPFGAVLGAIARPPEGRLLTVVYGRVATLTGLDVTEVRRLVRGGGLRGGGLREPRG